MDPAQWEQIKHILGLVADRPPEERPSLLQQLCGDNVALRREIESLLAHLDADPQFLEEPVVQLSSGTDSATDGTSGTLIDRYRILRRLGHGGMGEVHLAVHRDEGFERHVALKVIRPGLDTQEVLQRFRLERQILASLHHANIAQLLDAGATPDGRPYFAMEYVEGRPIDDYCDDRRLSVAARVALFLQVCTAVQHAHQNLVVHRDLKPSNILVAPDGVPKLLDFGIGKVLAPTSWLRSDQATRTAMRIMTPEYAAPEQIRGGTVTTATDVYGLGVLLYELLTGHRPYATDAMSLDQIERAVCEEAPSRPSIVVVRPETRRRPDGTTESVSPADIGTRRSTDPQRLRKRLTGDLDNILLKALRKEPERRYPSVAAFAEDLERHLKGLTVTARPDTITYRMSKFVRRHALGVTAASGAAVALIASSIIALTQSARVTHERDRAIEERAKAIEVRGFLMEMFGAVAPDQARDTVTVRQLLDRQSERIDEAYPNQPELRAQMMEVLADGYERLGLLESAEPMARRALEMRRDLYGDAHPDVAASATMLGWIAHERGRSEEARALLEEAVTIRRADGPQSSLELSRSLNDLGIVLETLGDLGRAKGLYREALAIRRNHLGDEHRSVGVTANNLATLLFRQAEYDSAVVIQETAVHALDASVGIDHQRSTVALSNLALFQRARGDPVAAVRTFRELLARQERIQGRQHPATAFVMNNLASVLNDHGEHEEAEQLAREALEIRRDRFGPAHGEVASSLLALGDILSDLGRDDEAEVAYQQGLHVRLDLYGADHYLTALALADLGAFNRKLDRLPAAQAYFERSVSAFTGSLGANHPQTANVQRILGQTMLERGDAAAALDVLRQSHDAAQERELSTLLRDTRLAMAEANRSLGRSGSADSLVALILPDSASLTEDQLATLERLRSR